MKSLLALVAVTCAACAGGTVASRPDRLPAVAATAEQHASATTRNVPVTTAKHDAVVLPVSSEKSIDRAPDETEVRAAHDVAVADQKDVDDDAPYGPAVNREGDATFSW